MRIPIEAWSVLALVVGATLIGIVGGLYYAGWNMRDVFVDNDTRVAVWLITLGEILGIYLLWATRPWGR